MTTPALRLLPLALVLAAAVTLPAMAQDQNTYLDDRSDGAAVVRSLYNAIARKEYARAYSYFGNKKPDNGNYQAFVDGYAKTVDVEVLIGTVEGDAGAGNLYEPVPVAIKSTLENGKEQLFAGCYVTRIVSPVNQEPPFTPFHIESAELGEVTGPIEKALPKTCHVP